MPFSLARVREIFCRHGDEIFITLRIKFHTKKNEAFKTVCFKSLKAIFSVEADKPI
jgi:hypothetical protein